MKQRLLALAAVLSALGGGTVVFLNWNDAKVDPTLESAGVWQVVDKSKCNVRACNAQACTDATNVLQDAGSSCVPRFADCDVRVSPYVRQVAQTNGLTLGPQKYQRVTFVALRCPGSDGGFAFGVPVDDGGWPVYAVATGQTPLCVRAPLDGGNTCLRRLSDGGTTFFGAGNVFNATESAGSNCEPVAAGCSAAGGIVFGDDPAVDL